jgi:hypothetical protein
MCKVPAAACSQVKQYEPSHQYYTDIFYLKTIRRNVSYNHIRHNVCAQIFTKVCDNVSYVNRMAPNVSMISFV